MQQNLLTRYLDCFYFHAKIINYSLLAGITTIWISILHNSRRHTLGNLYTVSILHSLQNIIVLTFK